MKHCDNECMLSVTKDNEGFQADVIENHKECQQVRLEFLTSQSFRRGYISWKDKFAKKWLLLSISSALSQSDFVMLHIAVWMTLPILIESAWSQEQFREVTFEKREPRFGFGFFEPIRKMYCKNFCTSADDKLYISNILCAVKCPELYLPHNATTIRIVTVPSSSKTSSTTTTTTTTLNPMLPPNAQGQAVQAMQATPATPATQAIAAKPAIPATQAIAAKPAIPATQLTQATAAMAATQTTLAPPPAQATQAP